MAALREQSAGGLWGREWPTVLVVCRCAGHPCICCGFRLPLVLHLLWFCFSDGGGGGGGSGCGGGGGGGGGSTAVAVVAVAAVAVAEVVAAVNAVDLF